MSPFHSPKYPGLDNKSYGYNIVPLWTSLYHSAHCASDLSKVFIRLQGPWVQTPCLYFLLLETQFLEQSWAHCWCPEMFTRWINAHNPTQIPRECFVQTGRRDGSRGTDDSLQLCHSVAWWSWQSPFTSMPLKRQAFPTVILWIR